MGPVELLVDLAVAFVYAASLVVESNRQGSWDCEEGIESAENDRVQVEEDKPALQMVPHGGLQDAATLAGISLDAIDAHNPVRKSLQRRFCSAEMRQRGVIAQDNNLDVGMLAAQRGGRNTDHGPIVV